MQKLPFTRKRLTLGVALIMSGLILLTIIPHPLSFQASSDVLLLSLSTILICIIPITFGAWLLTGSRIRLFLGSLAAIVLWVYSFLLPVLLLPLTQEALPIVIGFSSLIPIVSYFCYVKLKQKHKRNIGNKTELKN